MKLFSILIGLIVFEVFAAPVRSNVAAEHGQGDGQAMPYEARVEYLGCTGQQYINTGLTLFGVEMFWWDAAAASISDTAYDQRIFSTEGSKPVYYDTIWSSNNRIAVRPFLSYNRTPVCPVEAVVRSVYDGESLYCYYDGKLVAEKHGCEYTAVTNHLPLMLMTRSNNNLSKYRLCGKFYFARFWFDGELVRDMYPVRFTNEWGDSEGAMYDEVTGTLFRNDGTGAFLIGPDVE